MPTFLIDPTLTQLIVLGAVAAVGVFIWYQKRDRRTMVLATAAVLLFTIVFTLDWFIESPREAAVRKMQTIQNAANSRDWQNVFTHFSEKFRYDNFSKRSFQDWAAPLATQHEATVNFKSFDRDQVTYLPNDNVRIACIVQFSAPGANLIPYYMEATFAQEADREYRLVTFALYDYVKRREGGEQKMPTR